MNNISHSIVLVVAIVLLVLAVGLYYYPTSKAFKNKKVDKEFLLKNKFYFIFSLVSFVGSLVLFNLQFFLNEFNSTYITETLKISIDFLHNLMMYAGCVLGGISLFIFVSLLIYYFYFKTSYAEKDHRKLFWSMFGFGVLAVVFFFIFTEGNAPYLRYPLVNQIYIGSSGIRFITVNTGYNWAPAPKGDAFGFSIAFYALFILSGALIVLWICSYQYRQLYGSTGLLSTLFLIGFPSGIIGARLWYVVGNWTREGFDKNPMKIFEIWNGGLTIMGAFLAVVICVIYLLIIKYQMKKYPYTKMNFLILIDFVLPSLLFAQGIGRWGNFFNNEVHGLLMSQDAWMWLPSFIRDNMHFSNAYKVYDIEGAINALNSGSIYVPLFFIESITNIIGYITIEIGIRKGLNAISKQQDGTRKWYNHIAHTLSCQGSGLGWYFVWYGLTRVLLEPLRDKNFNMGEENQWSFINALIMAGSGVLIIVILAIWQYKRDNGKWIMKVEDSIKIEKND